MGRFSTTKRTLARPNIDRGEGETGSLPLRACLISEIDPVRSRNATTAQGVCGHRSRTVAREKKAKVNQEENGIPIFEGNALQYGSAKGIEILLA